MDKSERQKRGAVMKRLSAPAVKRREGLSDGSDRVKIIRESLPPHWLLSELLFHTITLCLDVYGEISARMLLDSASSIDDFDMGSDTFFIKLYESAYYKNQTLHNEWIETVPREERSAWKPEDYLATRDKNIPQYQTFIEVGRFFSAEYCHLPDDLRAVIDLAFSGFLRDAVTGSDFAALCADKALDVSALTCAQRMETPLDHEALCHALLVKLGHA